MAEYQRESHNRSAVWDLARVDEVDKGIVWCVIKDRPECLIPIRRGGSSSRNFSTTTVKRHFQKFHDHLLKDAESKKIK